MANETAPPASPAAKPWWQSKTVILNVIALLSLMIPPVGQWLKENPVEPVAVLAAINLLVRFATRGAVTWLPDNDQGGNGSTTGGSYSEDGYGNRSPGITDDFAPRISGVLPWLVGPMCAVLMLSLLPSCSPEAMQAVRSVPITIGVEGEHGTYGYSSKGGLSIAIKGKVREDKSGRAKAFEWPDAPKRRGVLPPIYAREEDFYGGWGKAGGLIRQGVESPQERPTPRL